LLAATFKVQANFGRNLRDLGRLSSCKRVNQGIVFDPEEEEEPTLGVIADKQIKPYLTLTVKRIRDWKPDMTFYQEEQELPK
jgi:hypothetical protein